MYFIFFLHFKEEYEKFLATMFPGQEKNDAFFAVRKDIDPPVSVTVKLLGEGQ
jgi:hypothetical protein